MSMWASSKLYHQYFDFLYTNTSFISVCSSQPDASSDAHGAYMSTGKGAMLAKSSTPSWTSSGTAGDVSGYKMTMAQEANITVSGSSGNATHVALYNQTSSQLLFVTTCNSKALTTADTVTVPAWDIEIAAPTSS